MENPYIVINDGVYAKPRYRIAYAYPTSPVADALNDGDGCWYVQCEFQREDGSFRTAPVVDAFGGWAYEDPALLQHLAEWNEDTGPARTLVV
tara:strand:- start:298 stop:573 length:276 start_codon:yes stop_codon:yes gene_type:complete